MRWAGKQSLITRIGILSILGPLPLAIDIMTFCICLHPTAFIVKLTILPIVPVRFFLLPSLTFTQRGLCGGERPKTKWLAVQLT